MSILIHEGCAYTISEHGTLLVFEAQSAAKQIGFVLGDTTRVQWLLGNRSHEAGWREAEPCTSELSPVHDMALQTLREFNERVGVSSPWRVLRTSPIYIHEGWAYRWRLAFDSTRETLEQAHWYVESAPLSACRPMMGHVVGPSDIDTWNEPWVQVDTDAADDEELAYIHSGLAALERPDRYGPIR